MSIQEDETLRLYVEDGLSMATVTIDDQMVTVQLPAPWLAVSVVSISAADGSLSPASGGKELTLSRQRVSRRTLERSLESPTVWNVSTLDAGI